MIQGASWHKQAWAGFRRYVQPAMALGFGIADVAISENKPVALTANAASIAAAFLTRRKTSFAWAAVPTVTYLGARVAGEIAFNKPVNPIKGHDAGRWGREQTFASGDFKPGSSHIRFAGRLGRIFEARLGKTAANKMLKTGSIKDLYQETRNWYESVGGVFKEGSLAGAETRVGLVRGQASVEPVITLSSVEKLERLEPKMVDDFFHEIAEIEASFSKILGRKTAMQYYKTGWRGQQRILLKKFPALKNVTKIGPAPKTGPMSWVDQIETNLGIAQESLDVVQRASFGTHMNPGVMQTDLWTAKKLGHLPASIKERILERHQYRYSRKDFAEMFGEGSMAGETYIKDLPDILKRFGATRWQFTKGKARSAVRNEWEDIKEGFSTLTRPIRRLRQHFRDRKNLKKRLKFYKDLMKQGKPYDHYGKPPMDLEPYLDNKMIKSVKGKYLFNKAVNPIKGHDAGRWGREQTFASGDFTPGKSWNPTKRVIQFFENFFAKRAAAKTVRGLSKAQIRELGKNSQKVSVDEFGWWMGIKKRAIPREMQTPALFVQDFNTAVRIAQEQGMTYTAAVQELKPIFKYYKSIGFDTGGYYDPARILEWGKDIRKVSKMGKPTDLPPLIPLTKNAEEVLQKSIIFHEFAENLTAKVAPKSSLLSSFFRRTGELHKTTWAHEMAIVQEEYFTRFAGSPLAKRYMGELRFLSGETTFSGFDDAYNTIQGLRHDGIAPELRKILTKFGSGWRGIFQSIGKFFKATGRKIRALPGTARAFISPKHYGSKIDDIIEQSVISPVTNAKLGQMLENQYGAETWRHALRGPIARFRSWQYYKREAKFLKEIGPGKGFGTQAAAGRAKRASMEAQWDAAQARPIRPAGFDALNKIPIMEKADIALWNKQQITRGASFAGQVAPIPAPIGKILGPTGYPYAIPVGAPKTALESLLQRAGIGPAGPALKANAAHCPRSANVTNVTKAIGRPVAPAHISALSEAAAKLANDFAAASKRYKFHRISTQAHRRANPIRLNKYRRNSHGKND